MRLWPLDSEPIDLDGPPEPELAGIQDSVVRSRTCPGFVAHREEVAARKSKRFADEAYRGRPAANNPFAPDCEPSADEEFAPRKACFTLKPRPACIKGKRNALVHTGGKPATHDHV